MMARRSNNDSFWLWGVALAVLIVGAATAVYLYQRGGDDLPLEPVADSPVPPVTAPAPQPSTAPPPQQLARDIPLPPLDESDADVQGGLIELVGNSAVSQFLVPERIVRNSVVTLDNLPRQKAAVQQRPIKSTPGEFIVSGPEDARVIAPENYARYAPFVAVVQSLDANTLVALYRGLQPLFQQAYEDLGHPNGFFNSRLLEVIEHLLATPEVPQPVRLVQPSVYYRYADPKLEELSAGQKLLIRMGPENAAIIKAKLREIQAALR
jgi:hypothetical protein